MSGLRALALPALALLALAPLALAQEDPSVNESDFDTSTPPEDESYFEDEDAAPGSEEPTLSESDFDASTPPADEAYLDEPTMSEQDFDTSVPAADEAYLAEDAPEPSARTPGVGTLALVATLAMAALGARRG